MLQAGYHVANVAWPITLPLLAVIGMLVATTASATTTATPTHHHPPPPAYTISIPT